jgi:hypothetical protein
MAEAAGDFSCNKNGVAGRKCETCIASQNYFNNLTMELESANLIVKFLERGANTTVDSKWIKPAQTDKSSDLKDRDISNNKWITVTNNRTGYSSKFMSSLTRNINPVLTTSNRFASLSNLNDPLTTTIGDLNTPQTTSEKYPVSSKKK